MSDPKFVEWTTKTPKEYPCKKGCGVKIQYAKFFGSDGKLLTTDGKPETWQNVGWPTNPNTQKMHECAKLDLMDQNIAKKESEVKRTDLLDKTESLVEDYPTEPQAKELTIDDLSLGNLKGEVLAECAILWKEEEWITNYLKIKSGGEPPNPAKVGMWHKLISERLARSHESS